MMRAAGQCHQQCIIFRLLVLVLVCGAITGTGLSDDTSSAEVSKTGSQGILCTVLPRDPFVDEEIQIIGQVVADVPSLSDHEVIILAQPPGSGGYTPFCDTSPDREGYFECWGIPDSSGEWKFRAYYCGISSETVSVTIRPRPYPEETHLTLEAWPVYPVTGDTVTFSGHLYGRISGGLADKTITYYVARAYACGGILGRCGWYEESLRWERFGSKRTDSQGFYSIQMPVVETGNVVVRTEFEGDESAYPARSRSLYFSVTT